MKTTKILSLSLGSVIAAAALMPMAHAGNNPFAAKQLSAGYQLAQADKKADGKCGEAKCGADKKAAEKMKEGKSSEAKCGSDKKSDKKTEASCGAAK
ncbi:MAG: hypothetical protein ACOYB3_12490 [Azonexus sp.]